MPPLAPSTAATNSDASVSRGPPEMALVRLVGPSVEFERLPAAPHGGDNLSRGVVGRLDLLVAFIFVQRGLNDAEGGTEIIQHSGLLD